jgi:hypothetical protein
MTEGDQPPFYYVGPDGQLAGSMLRSPATSHPARRQGELQSQSKSFNAVVELVAQGGADIAISSCCRARWSGPDGPIH